MIVTVVLASVLALTAHSRQVDKEVKLTVYYESLCPDSVKFINEQLEPALSLLQEELTISLKPFGKANFTANDQSWDFTCQHGPNECWGNKIQACALKYVSDDYLFPLINCMMMNNINAGVEVSATACLSATGLGNSTSEEVMGCSKGTEDSTLLHDLGVETHDLQPALTYVPWILFNDVFVEDDWQAAQEDLTKVLCEKYLTG